MPANKLRRPSSPNTYKIKKETCTDGVHWNDFTDKTKDSPLLILLISAMLQNFVVLTTIMQLCHIISIFSSLWLPVLIPFPDTVPFNYLNAPVIWEYAQPSLLTFTTLVLQLNFTGWGFATVQTNRLYPTNSSFSDSVSVNGHHPIPHQRLFSKFSLSLFLFFFFNQALPILFSEQHLNFIHRLSVT